jgi:hypothetical protein
LTSRGTLCAVKSYLWAKMRIRIRVALGLGLGVVATTTEAFSTPHPIRNPKSCESTPTPTATATNQPVVGRPAATGVASLATAATALSLVMCSLFLVLPPPISAAAAPADNGRSSTSLYRDFGGTGGTAELVAARSGGRAGGRSRTAKGRRSLPKGGGGSTVRMYNTNPRPQTTTIVPTYVTPAPVFVTPGIGFGYNPFGFGFGAAGGIGNVLNDVRQDSELDRVQQELQNERVKEADMEARIRALEMSRGTGGTGGAGGGMQPGLQRQMQQTKPEEAAVAQ